MIEEPARITGPVVQPDSVHKPNDSDWTTEQIMMKPKIISQVNWTTADVYGTRLDHLLIPEVINNVSSLQINILRLFIFYRMTLKFMFQLNATKFHMGRLQIVYDPMRQLFPPDSTTIYKKQLHPSSNSGFNHVVIKAPDQNSAIISIPFAHIQDSLSTNSGDGFDVMGAIHSVVLSPLQCSTNARNNVYLTTFMWFEDVHLAVPIYDHNLLIPEFHKDPAAFIKFHRDLDPEFDKYMSTFEPKAEMVSGLSSLAMSAASSATGLDFNKIVGIGSNFVKNVVGANADKPTNSQAPNQLTVAPISSIASGNGIDRSVRLDVDLKSFTQASPCVIGARADEMDIDVIRKMPMIFNTNYTWLTTHNPGDLLFSLDVYPTLSYSETVNVQNSMGTQFKSYAYYNTFLRYLTLPYDYWRGGIVFTFDFVATSFHSGELMFVFIPNKLRSTLPALTYDQAKSCPATMFQLSETNHEISIPCPYQSVTPWKQTFSFEPVSSGSPVEPHVYEVLGVLYCFVVNGLAIGESVPNNVPIIPYISAADDFQVKYYRGVKETTGPVDYYVPPIPTAEMCSGESRSDNMNEDVPVTMIKGSGWLMPKNFEENYTETMLDYMRTYDLTTGTHELLVRPYLDIYPPDVNSYTFRFQVSPTTIIRGSEEIPSPGSLMNHLNFFSSMYTFWRGSLRFKMLYVGPSERDSSNFDNNFWMLASYDPTNTQLVNYTTPSTFHLAITNIFNHRTHITHTRNVPVLEIEIPFRTYFNQLLVNPSAFINYNGYAYSGYVNFTNFGLPKIADSPPNNYFKGQFMALAAAGDDYRVSFLTAPPITFSSIQYVP